MPAKVKAKPKAKAKPTKPAKKPAPRTTPKSKPSFLDRIASFVPPPNAYGVSRVPAGFAASEPAAVLLGLGYPHVLVTLDEPLAPLPDHATYKKHYLGAVAIPRDLPPIMYAVSRADPSTEALDKAVVRPATRPPLEKATIDALRYGGRDIVSILEAVYGTEPTAAAIVDALEAAKIDDLNGGKYENYGYSIIYMLGRLLWRVPAGVRTAHRARLTAVLDRLRGAGELWRSGRALDVILGGRAGVERSGRNFNGQLFLSEYVFADDDPAWVAREVLSQLERLRPSEREQFDIQLAVVGGPDVLSALRGNTKRFPKDQAKSIDAQLALCA